MARVAIWFEVLDPRVRSASELLPMFLPGRSPPDSLSMPHRAPRARQCSVHRTQVVDGAAVHPRGKRVQRERDVGGRVVNRSTVQANQCPADMEGTERATTW
jgi:hypothetical protein